MRRTLLRWVICGQAMLPGLAFAQGFAEQVTAAEQQIADKQWSAALAALLPLQAQAASDPERERLAGSLYGVGAALRREGDAGAALQAHEAALALRRLLGGGSDDARLSQSLDSVAGCLHALGRPTAALPHFEAALSMRQRLFADADHPAIAQSLGNLANCLLDLGQNDAALTHYQAALAMQERLHEGRDHPFVAMSLANVGSCLWRLGRAAEALPYHERALALRKRIYGDIDEHETANGINNMAVCLLALGRMAEARQQAEAGLAMCRRLFGDRDHPMVASALNTLCGCLRDTGRDEEALQGYRTIAAMYERMVGQADHPDVALNLSNMSVCLVSMGRPTEGLAAAEAGLAMFERLSRGRATFAVARHRNNVAGALTALGRADEALPILEALLAMSQGMDATSSSRVLRLANVANCLEALGRGADALQHHQAALELAIRLHGDSDHPEVAEQKNNVAGCLLTLGRADEALPMFEASLAMYRRLFGDVDHPNIALGLNNAAFCLRTLGRYEDALPRYELALAMRQRLCGGRDHPLVAFCLNNLGSCLSSLQRLDDALPRLEAALAMRERLYGDVDHPARKQSLSNVSLCLQKLGRFEQALPLCERAVAMIERLRDDSRLSPELRQSYFDDLKHGNAFEQLQSLTARFGQGNASWQAAERSRGRGLLDLIGEQRFDALDEAERRARQRGDERSVTRLGALRTDLAERQLERDRLLHDLVRLDDQELPDADRLQRRTNLLARSDEVTSRLRQLLDERARLLGDVLPLGTVRTAAQVQAVLQPDEVLLQFTVTENVQMLYVLAREGEVEVVELPHAQATVARVLPEVLPRVSMQQLAARGRDPAAEQTPARPAADGLHELFTSLVPPAVWQRIRGCRRVFVAAHRELHRLPFELLVTGHADGKPIYWLDDGPAVAYVPSGSALHWLRRRADDAGDDVTALDLLSVGDPIGLEHAPEVPATGAYVLAVEADSEGARAGLLPGDVLLRYDAEPLRDDKALRDARMRTEVAVEEGTRAKTPIPIELWRRGEKIVVDVKPGLLGVEVGRGEARVAHEESLNDPMTSPRVTRTSEIERLGRLPPLRGARAESEAITQVFATAGDVARSLLGEAATEAAVFDLAAKAKYLHFACHGIADEYAGQSLSMLVLSQPERVLPGDDGLLKLSDLLGNWRGRLSSCRLVVLSACRTNVGPTLRDEAPQALPIGFLFAGAPSVISSLWAVDDASTRELMTDFYGRLLAGETDKLKAFTAAKQALRAKHPDPFHWAPFLFLGSPQ